MSQRPLHITRCFKDIPAHASHAPGARDRAEHGKPGRRKLIKIQGQLIIVMAKGLRPIALPLSFLPQILRFSVLIRII
jgi:hypothetical protein